MNPISFGFFRIPSLTVLIVLLLFSCKKDELSRELKVETKAISEIMATSAKVSGEIIDVGEGITDHGHCWANAANPTISDFKNSLGPASKRGVYTSELLGLEAGEHYYVRAYLKSGEEITYGADSLFSTPNGEVSLTTSEVSNITANSATCGGNVLSVNGDEIVARGFCWDTLSSVNSSNKAGFVKVGEGLGPFNWELTDLMPDKIYFLKAWAVTNIDTTFTEARTFTTLNGIAAISANQITLITASSAVCGGTISNDGGAPIIARGVCWSTNQNPTTEHSKTVEGSGTGSFTSNLIGLQANQTYYLRVYSLSPVLTSYSIQQSFVTRNGQATIITHPINQKSINVATCAGEITDDGGAPVLSRGIVWGEYQSPTVLDQKAVVGSGNGYFTGNIDEPQLGQTYYVRAYATNAVTTTYGNQQSFVAKNGIAAISTSLTSQITATTAKSGGSISDDGGSLITSSGICWSTEQNPTTSDNKIINESGTLSYVANISGLQPNQTYYIRAFAINSIGTYYGNQQIFTSKNGIVLLSTDDESQLTATTAISGGIITEDGGSSITARGICWSLLPNPTVESDKTIEGTGTGAFSSNLSGLLPDQTYYFRAYASNSLGTYYGNENILKTKNGRAILTTTIPTEISAISAVSGGIISDNGGSLILSKGVCWSENPEATILNDKTINGTGEGQYASALSGLLPNHTYFVRAYASTAITTSYGDEQTVTTKNGLPIINTTPLTEIDGYSALGGGEITDDGGLDVIGRGICWGTEQTPTVTDNRTIDGAGPGIFSSSISDLSLNSTYYVRAYVSNSIGTFYGNEISFTTTLNIGDYYEGGIVAYIHLPGYPGYIDGEVHGLIAAPTSFSSSFTWFFGNSQTMAIYTTIGAGDYNTKIIVKNYGSGSYAASFCYDLVLNGFSDWFLPSIDELTMLYRKREAIGGFTFGSYWSSSEVSNNGAWGFSCSDGLSSIIGKGVTLKVRAIRAF